MTEKSDIFLLIIVWLALGVIGYAWTNGAGTDIRLKTPACKFWEPMEKDK